MGVGTDFDAFISYRRLDGRLAARWLRNSLISYKIPKDFLPESCKTQPKLRVYRDETYERPSEDFFSKSVEPALLASKSLILVATPSILRPLQKGEVNWVEREIRSFMSVMKSDTKGQHSIIVVRAKGDIGGNLPDVLSAEYPRIQQLDIRGVSRFFNWWPPRRSRLREAVVRIGAEIHGIETKELPALLREEERRQQKSLWIAIALLSLIVIVISSLAAIAIHQREQAQKRLVQIQKGNELLAGVFDDLDIRRVRQSQDPLEVILASRLADASNQLNSGIVGDPETVALLQIKLGTSLNNLGAHEKAIEILEASVPELRRFLGIQDVDTLAGMNTLAVAYHDAGKLSKALLLQTETLDARKQHLGSKHPHTVVSMNNLAKIHEDRGELNLAQSLLEECHDILVAERRPNDTDLLDSMHNLGGINLLQGNYEDAIGLLEEARDGRREVYGDNHLLTLETMNDLGWALINSGKAADAIPIFENVVESTSNVAGIKHPSTLIAMNNLGSALRNAGNTEAAIPILEESAALMAETLGTDHHDTLAAVNNLMSAFQHVGRHEKARSLAEKLVAQMKVQFGDKNPNTMAALSNFALIVSSCGDDQEAQTILELLLPNMRTVLGNYHPTTISTAGNLAGLREKNSQSTEALQLYEETANGAEAELGIGNSNAQYAMLNLAGYYSHIGTPQKAIPIWHRLVNFFEQELGPSHETTLQHLASLAKCHREVGDIQKSINLLTDLIERGRKSEFHAAIFAELLETLLTDERDQAAFTLVEEELNRTKANGPIAYSESLARIGSILLKVGRHSVKAESILRECLRIRVRESPEDWKTYYTHTMLGHSLLQQGEYDAAKNSLEKGHAGLKQSAEQMPIKLWNLRLSEAIELLIELAEKSHHSTDLEKWEKARVGIRESI